MQDAFLVNGGKKLKGEVMLSGAKNVALKIIIAALLFEQEIILKNIPRIKDVDLLLELIKNLGGRAEFIAPNTVVVDGRQIKNNKIDLLLGAKIRASFMFFAPLLKKFRQCYVPNPGGCRIGARPIDRIVKGIMSLGIEVEYDSKTGYYFAQVGKKINYYYLFNKPSHTGTELLILIGVVLSLLPDFNHKIVIDNAALEPEIDDLIRFMNLGGATIKRLGKRIEIGKTIKLEQKVSYSIISDRNEAITYASLAVAGKGEIIIKSLPKLLINTFLDKLQQIGAGVEELQAGCFRFFYQSPLSACNIETNIHPGFMTDWQPNWAVIMTQAYGTSRIVERVFENRFAYVKELNKLGAHIEFAQPKVADPQNYYYFNFEPQKIYQQAILIHGPKQLHSGVINITDLRAGATLAIAALIAQGESIINGASILERGYENFGEKIAKLGGEIKKI
jgi:UDP-N-acetylglucosamine 1-carboxyvinyltransferase